MDIETGSKGGDGIGWDVNADSALSLRSSYLAPPLCETDGTNERTNWVIALMVGV